MSQKKANLDALNKLLGPDIKNENESENESFHDLIKKYNLAPVKKVKRPRGRPKKADADKVQVMSLKMPPNMIRFLDELVLPHPKAKGRGGKVRYMMVHFVKMKKREIEQLKVLVSQLKIFDQELSKIDPKKRSDKNEMRSIEVIINSLRALVDIYRIEMKDYKRTLKDEDYRLLELALSYNARKK